MFVPGVSDTIDVVATRLRRSGLRWAFYAGVAGYALALVVAGRDYGTGAGLVPALVGTAVLALVCLRAVVGQPTGEYGGVAGTVVDEPDDPPPDPRRTVVAFGWLAGLVGAVVLVGLLPAFAVVVPAFVARYHGYRAAALAGAGVLLFVAVLFVLVLDVPPYEPVVVRVLAGGLGG